MPLCGILSASSGRFVYLLAGAFLESGEKYGKNGQDKMVLFFKNVRLTNRTMVSKTNYVSSITRAVLDHIYPKWPEGTEGVVAGARCGNVTCWDLIYLFLLMEINTNI